MINIVKSVYKILCSIYLKHLMNCWKNSTKWFTGRSKSKIEKYSCSLGAQENIAFVTISELHSMAYFTKGFTCKGLYGSNYTEIKANGLSKTA